MKNLSRIALIWLSIVIVFSCSGDDDRVVVIPSSFVTNNSTDFFINKDGTVDLTINGAFSTGNDLSGDVVSRGFVYGTTFSTIPNANNTITATGPQNEIIGQLKNLPSGNTYYIRGFFELNDGTYFYGNEIQASTSANASNTRSIKIEMESTPFFVSSTEITPQINITEVKKEMPIEVGFEYSTNNDFSNSTIRKADNYTGEHIQGNLLIKSYQEVISGLNPSTVYYFRPYSKYKDGTITNGGTSTVSHTTNN